MNIVLMGDSKAGRSSIAKVIFQKMVSKQTMLLAETTKVETYQFKIQKMDFRLYDFPARYDTEDIPPNEQMILKNASALIFVLNPQAETFRALEEFLVIQEYLKKINTRGCSMFLFTNKADIDLQQVETRNEYQLKLKKKIGDDGIDPKEIEFYFTSIYDYSIFQAFSRVIQKMIPCSRNICRLLNHFSEHSKVDKIYVFDLLTKLCIAHNDQTLIDPLNYQICSEMLDIFIDISFLYGTDKSDSSADSESIVKLSKAEEETELVILKSMERYLALVLVIKECNYDRPYLIEINIAAFKKGFGELMTATLASLK